MKINISYCDLSTIIEIVDRSVQELQTRLQGMKAELREINENTINRWKRCRRRRNNQNKRKINK